MGVGAIEEGKLPSADTLLTLLSICERMLADHAWLAERPVSWQADLEALRERLAEQLAKHAEGYASGS
jgi:hypothetical protein